MTRTRLSRPTTNSADAATLDAVALPPEVVGERIRDARLAKGWTHQDFADEVSQLLGRRINLRTVQRWQKGRDRNTGKSWLPRLKTLMDVADLLEVPRSHLVEEEPAEGVGEEVRERLAALEESAESQRELLAELLRLVRGDQEQPGSGTLGS